MSNMYHIEDFFDSAEQRELDRALVIVSGRRSEEFCISYIGRGQNYLIFLAATDDQNFCVRVGNIENKESIFDLKKALRICESNNIVTNKVLFSDFTCKKIHCPYMITTFISGSMYDLSRFQEKEISQFFTDFGKYLATLHSIKHTCFLKELNKENELDIRKYLSRRYIKLYEELNRCENISIDIIGLDKIYQVLYGVIDFESIVPRFVHRDISANNIIQNNSKFQCLIDFEHSIFFDAIWDFAKLELNILSAINQEYRECFLKSYQSIIPLEKDSYERFLLYYMLELMWAVINDYNDSRNLYLDILRGFIEKGI